MKKFMALFMALLILFQSFAAFTPPVPPKKANEVFIPVGKEGKKISLLTLSQINIAEFEQQSGYDMKLMDKVTFKLAQRELRKTINPDGSFNNNKVHKFMKRFGGETGFHVGGFALGFLLGLIGILIAYLINDDYKSNRRKWAWIGWGVFVVIYLAFVLAMV
jgi:hypothetical protein